MRENLFVLAILLLTSAFAFSQTDARSAAQNGKSQTPKHKTITGCLTGKPKQYRLVDQKGTTTIVYSKTLDFDPYVGRSVTLVGDESATPSADEGTARPMPVFWALEVQPASGKCK
jgi:hypothetical protein